ncbi:MAG: TonB-dependent receptor [Pedobacter sp.]|uniref:SusC/RagA family TonB-linked outer membrane protein n=1 Tax=Pedobacter sp. TaxID=1411316 RepID=UPI002806F856|nr:TonB-dependent receptor [Pedobacter sp.]MDQ8005196.1 TonB-dependent receptor [Pedobacter sp.]
MKKIFTELSVIACFLLLLLSDVAYAQNVTVKGVVNDDQNLPIPGVSVVVKGTNNGVQTDANGAYTISAPSNSTLTFSFIGFNNQEVAINNRTLINITLQTATNDLQQVVVVGYGTQQKKDLTGSIASVKGEEIEKMTVTNPMNALQGKVPGLTISTSGAPGSGGTVRIRGIASTNNANPLYVVDGVFQDNIDYLNPADIETIDVLKDASSTAIYGLRGANGVIAITTKRAAKGKSTINFTSTVGFQKVEKLIDVTDAEGFKKLFSATLAATGATPFDYTNYTGNTNWQKEILRDAFINTNSLSISNTGEKSTTLLNVGYNDQDGLIKYGNFKKFIARLSQETKLNDAIKIGGDITGYHYRNNPSSVGLNAGVWSAPIVDVRSANGLYNAMPSFQQTSVGNPAYTIDRTRNTSINRGYRATGSLFGEVKFLKDFTWRSTVYADLRFNSIRAYTPLPYPIVYLGEGSNATRTFVDQTARTTVRQEAFERRMFQQDHTVTFNKTIKEDHKINAVAGFTTINQSNTNLIGSRTDSTLAVPNNPDLWYLNVISQDNITTNSGTGDLESNVGFFGRVSYSYKSKYLLNATVRRDGSSKFAPQNRWGTFGSVGLGWIISEENFFKDVKGIDFLKLRTAWGRLGNSNAIPNNVYQQTLNTSSSAVFGEFTYPSIAYAFRPDPNLHWEVIQGFDVGVDVRALNNRLSAEVNYYDKQTTDLFTRVFLPDDPSRPYYTNLGKVTNKGTEVALGWNDKIGSELTYNIAGNFSYVKNNVVSIGNASNFQLVGNGGANLTETGRSIGYFYGFRQVGVYQSTADLDRMPRMLTSLPGDIAYEDINGDGVITTADRTYLGTPFPPYSYGLSISLGYKGFDFSVDGQGVAGNKIYTQWKTANFAQLNYPSNRLNAWTGPGSSNVEPIIVPRANNLLFSSYFLEDGSYFRLRNIQVGYTFPKSLLAKAGVQKLRVYASGQNIKTWSKVSGYSPEAQLSDILASGADNGVYPVPSIYSFGLNLTF